MAAVPPCPGRPGPARLVAAGALVLVSFAVAPAQQAAEKVDVLLVGRIVSVLHEGVPAAEVWATDARGKVLGRTVADGDGGYRLARLPFVHVRVHARGGDKVEGSIGVAASGLVREATLVLEDGEPVRGTVLMPDGSAAAGAAILVECADEPGRFGWREETTADAKGAWSLPMAPLRPLVVHAFVPGHPFAEQEVPRGRDGDVAVAIPAGELKQRRVRVRGIPAGQDARVEWLAGNPEYGFNYRLPSPVMRAAVDADGVATLWQLPVDCIVVVVAGLAQAVAPCPADTTELEIDLAAQAANAVRRGKRVSAKVVDDVGVPLAGVTVVGSYKWGSEHLASAVTTADGTFEIDIPLLESVPCAIGLSAREWRFARGRLGRDGVSWLTLAGAGDVPRLEAQRAGGIKATLRGPTGAPLAAARVEILGTGRDASCVVSATDAAGHLDVAGLPPGTYSLVATVAGIRGSTKCEVCACDLATPPALEFATLGEVAGVVVDGNGRAVPSAVLWLCESEAFVEAMRHGSPCGYPRVPILANRHGRYRAPGLGIGEWLFVTDESCQGNVPHPFRFTIEPSRVTTCDVTVGEVK